MGIEYLLLRLGIAAAAAVGAFLLYECGKIGKRSLNRLVALEQRQQRMHQEKDGLHGGLSHR